MTGCVSVGGDPAEIRKSSALICLFLCCWLAGILKSRISNLSAS